jgi:succinate dehydrogenase/fumarate reductase cytochrome b subunit
MFPYYFIRFSGPVLFVLVGLKLLSGYAVVGRAPGLSWLSPLHENALLDVLLLVLFIFHAFYGLRLFLIDLGMVKRERLLFWVATIVSVILLIFSYSYFL